MLSCYRGVLWTKRLTVSRNCGSYNAISNRGVVIAAAGAIPPQQQYTGFNVSHRQQPQPQLKMMMVPCRGFAKKTWAKRKKGPKVTANEDIKGTEFRVVDEDGTQLGVMQREDAFKQARDHQQDLVLVAPEANPPVCKLTSAVKLKRKREKEAKEAEKQERANKLKEMRFTSKIEPHDLEVKIEKVRKFLREEQRNVRVTVAYNPGVPHAYQEPLRRKVLRQIVKSINNDAYADPKTLQAQGPFIMLDLKAGVVKKDPDEHFAILSQLEKPLQVSSVVIVAESFRPKEVSLNLYLVRRETLLANLLGLIQAPLQMPLKRQPTQITIQRKMSLGLQKYPKRPGRQEPPRVWLSICRGRQQV